MSDLRKILDKVIKQAYDEGYKHGKQDYTSSVLEYRGYQSKIKVSKEDKILYGKIEGIDDHILFEGDTVNEIEKAFHEAVDDYLALCADVGKEP